MAAKNRPRYSLTKPQVVVGLLSAFQLLDVLIAHNSAGHLSAGGRSSTDTLDEFLASLKTLSVVEKQTVQFTCEFNQTSAADPNSLIWIRLRKNETGNQHDTRLISHGERLLVPDARFAVSRLGHLSTSWLLTLSQAKPTDDNAFYLCQGAGGSRTGFLGGAKLQVLVPPQFVVQDTSPSLIQAPELEPIDLKCTVSSRPRSQLHWKREDEKPITGADQHTGQEASNDVALLHFRSFRRHQSGAYLCIASNGVQGGGVSLRVSLQPVSCRSGNSTTAPLESCEPTTTERPTNASWFGAWRPASKPKPPPTERRNGGRRRPAQENQRQASDADRVSIKRSEAAASSASVSTRCAPLIWLLLEIGRWTAANIIRGNLHYRL